MANAVPPSKRRRWLKRSLLLVLGLFALLAVFHRPVFRAAADWGARYLATKAGYKLEWELGGNVLSDVTVKKLRLTGAEGSIVKKIEWNDAGASYDLWTLMRKGPAEFLRDVRLVDADIELDLRTKPKAKTERKKIDYWIKHIDLHNVNARILTLQGDVMLRGLTLALNENEEGQLSIDELVVPSKVPRLTNVRGKTNVEGRSVRLTDVVVAPDLTIERLDLDLGELSKGALPLKIDARSGEATVKASGRVEQIWDVLALDLSAKLHRVGDQELRRWAALPQGMRWRIEDADVRVKGPPRNPQKLSGTLSATATLPQIAGLRLDSVRANAELNSGSLRVESLTAQTGSNSAKVTGTATLPATWRQMRSLSTDLQWQVNAPDLGTLFIDPSRYAGTLRGKGALSLHDGRLVAADANLDGSNLKLRQWNIASLAANVSTDAKVVRLHSVTARLDDQNSIKIDGEVQLEGNQAASLMWKIEGGDLAALARWAPIKNLQPPDAGKLTANGTAQFSFVELIKDGPGKLRADGSAQLDGLLWQQRNVEKASLEFSLSNQVIEVNSLDVRIDERNNAHFAGNLSLAGKKPVQLSWQADLRNLASVAQWIDLKDAPPPTAGTFVTRGEASGSIEDLRRADYAKAIAQGTARLDGVRWQKAPMDSAVLDFALRDGRAEVKRFHARFDAQNTITAKGHVMLDQTRGFDADVSGKLDQLKDVSGWFELAKAPRITSGRADFSWTGKGQLSTRDMTGSASVHATDVRREGSGDAFSLALEARHDGKRAEISKLQFTSGIVRGEATAVLSDTELSVPRLSVFSGDLRLVEGTVQVPLMLAKKPSAGIPVDPRRPIAINLRVDKLDIAKLLAALGQKPAAHGILSAVVGIQGTLPEVSGQISGTVQNVRAAAAPSTLEPASIQINGTIAKNRLDLTATGKQKPLQTLTAKVRMTVEAEKLVANPRAFLDVPIEASVNLPNSDLSQLKPFIPMLAELQGTVGINVRGTGTIKSPQWEGDMHLDVPSAELKQGPMSIRDMKARASLAGPILTVNELSATLSGGSIRGGGTVNLAPLTDPTLDLHLDAKEALIVRDDTMSLRADGRLTCTGPLSEALVAGRMELVRGRIFKEIEFLPLSLPNQLPPPPPPVRRSAATPSLPPPFHQWTFDIDVVTRDPVRLLGNVLNGGAVTNLHVGGTGAAPIVDGKISLDGARVRLPFSRLAISRGDITFEKGNPRDPRLDLQGETVVNNYIVNVRAYGSALAPKLSMTSSPPLKENEIATLLATGSTAGGGGTMEGEAANRAAFLVIKQMYRKLLGKTTPKRFDEAPPRLTFTFSPLSSGNSQRGVTATYEISPEWQAVGTVGDRGFRGLLHYLIRFR